MRFVAIFAFSMAGAGIAAEESIVVNFPKGKRITIEQTLVLESIGLDENGKNGPGSSGNPDLKLVEKWVDRSESDEGGQCLKLERSVVSSLLRVLSDPELATGLDKTVLLVNRETGGCRIERSTGNPPDRTLKLMGRAPPEPVELLLPDVPVKSGSTYDISEDRMLAFFDAVGAGLTSAKGSRAESIQSLVTCVMGSEGQSLIKAVALKATVKFVKNGDALIEIKGKKNTVDKNLKDVKGYGGPGFTDISGQIQVKSGLPARLEFTMKQVRGKAKNSQPPPRPDLFDPIAIKDDWKLTRVYATGK